MLGMVWAILWWGVVLFAGVQAARAWGPGRSALAVLGLVLLGGLGWVASLVALVGAVLVGYRAEEAMRPALPGPGPR